ncbi:uncharacterized protein Bfra_003916 [Botrytis fragariae]|uniref:Uncharacterized protein n=1 Tax=Botrytis fragariae TaxID=1964551 RepID=A0A8H6EKD2_9HELO|nr:uncharacterized protein Bfra_003916 [Botrytis fragariae]KAF5875462.1 hypothetical protein Bfra_003916 [Botrytis fragariae]
MAPVPISRFSGISLFSRDVAHSASLTSRTTPILQPISTILQPRNGQSSSPSTLTKFLTRLISRQTTSSNPSIIPTTYGQQNNSPSPGTIVGIVLGSVGGFLLLLWLLYTCCTLGRRQSAQSTVTEDVTFRENVRRRSHNSHRSSRPHSRRVSTTEKVEIRRQRSRSPAPVRVVREEVRQETRRPPPPVERVIVEERREVRRSRERSPSSSGGGSDEVVVIEEHDPPRRSKSKRERRERGERAERDSGFRTVDPLSFGGVVGGEGRRETLELRLEIEMGGLEIWSNGGDI